MLSLTDVLSSRYLTFTSLRDAGIDTERASLVTDILRGRESADDDQVGVPLEWRPAEPPYEPSEADWQDSCQYLDRVETLEAIHRYEDEAFAREVGR
jgi:hypothetical protein